MRVVHGQIHSRSRVYPSLAHCEHGSGIAPTPNATASFLSRGRLRIG